MTEVSPRHCQNSKNLTPAHGLDYNSFETESEHMLHDVAYLQCPRDLMQEIYGNSIYVVCFLNARPRSFKFKGCRENVFIPRICWSVALNWIIENVSFLPQFLDITVKGQAMQEISSRVAKAHKNIVMVSSATAFTDPATAFYFYYFFYCFLLLEVTVADEGNLLRQLLLFLCRQFQTFLKKSKYNIIE